MMEEKLRTAFELLFEETTASTTERLRNEKNLNDTGRRLLATSYCKGGHHHKIGAGNWDHHPGNRRFITNFKIKDVKEVMMEEN